MNSLLENPLPISLMVLSVARDMLRIYITLKVNILPITQNQAKLFRDEIVSFD